MTIPPFLLDLLLLSYHIEIQVTSMNEDRNVWSIYLNKALLNGEEKYFETALEFTKVEVWTFFY